jgi:hypothetical protein
MKKSKLKCSFFCTASLILSKLLLTTIFLYHFSSISRRSIGRCIMKCWWWVTKGLSLLVKLLNSRSFWCFISVPVFIFIFSHRLHLYPTFNFTSNEIAQNGELNKKSASSQVKSNQVKRDKWVTSGWKRQVGEKLLTNVIVGMSSNLPLFSI